MISARRMQAILLLVVVLLSCALSCSSSPPPDDVVLAPNTKVLDADARAAVTAYSKDDGTITFGHSTPFTDSLAVGDVVASQTNPPVAPWGFLRKIGSIDRSGGQVVLKTDQATLADALQSAHVRQIGRIPPLDSSATSTAGLSKGMSVRSKKERNLVHTKTIPAGQGTALHFEHTQLAVNGNPGDPSALNGVITLDGDVVFDGGFSLDIDVDLLGVHHFLAQAELDVDTDLQIQGQVYSSFDVHTPDATEVLTPIDIQVGPLPVVLVPELDIHVGLSGTAAFNLSFHETSSTTVTVGARYDDGPGWQNLTGANGTGNLAAPPSVSFSLDLEAYARVEAGIYLYGVAGPYFFGQMGFEVNATVPRHPFLEAGAHMQFGCGVKVKVLGATLADYSFTGVDAFFPVFQSQNQPPIAVITSPADGERHVARDSIHFEAGILDLEDGTDDENHVKAVWTSDLDGELGHGPSFATTLRNPSPGPHVVTLTVTDSDGAVTTAQRTIDLQTVAASAQIDAPAEGATLTSGQPYLISGHADDPNVGSSNVCIVSGYQVSWSSNVASDTFADAHGCPGTTVTFGPVAGAHTLTLTASGPYGEQAVANAIVNVVTPPPGTLPFQNPYGGEIVQATNGQLSAPLQILLKSPTPASATYTWTATSYEQDERTVHATTSLGTSSTPDIDWAQPNATPGFISLALAQSGKGQYITVHVTAIDASNAHYTGDVSFYFAWVPG